MRYLWVEDFNDDNSITSDELKKRFKDFFDFKDDKLIIKSDLLDAIKFMENKNSLYEVDSFLIDIRFPTCKKDIDQEAIYQEYFNEIVTREFFDDKKNDATGILFYLLLIFRYQIEQKKIAFISANINSGNGKINLIQNLVEIIEKSRLEKLSDEDKINYRSSERSLGLKLKFTKETKPWKTFISNDNIIQKIDINELLNTIKALPLNYYERIYSNEKSEKIDKFVGSLASQSKYNDVKRKFDMIGLMMPAAFEKPKFGNERIKKRYAFLAWEKELYKEPYNAIRSNVLEMCIILINALGQESSDSLYSNFLKLLTGSHNYYDNQFFIRYLEDFMSIFTINGAENIKMNCKRILKEMSALWEASVIPKYSKSKKLLNNEEIKRNGKEDGKYFVHYDSCYCACHATMKIMRNWTGHQGIKDIKIEDIGLFFIICMRGIFDIDRLSDNNYKIYENKLLEVFKYDDKIKVNIDDKKSLEYFKNLNALTVKQKLREETNDDMRIEIYNSISGLGCSKSEIRERVSIDDIYILLYHLMKQGNGCYGFYIDIVNSVTYRAWQNWEDRYDDRFEDLYGYKEIRLKK